MRFMFLLLVLICGVMGCTAESGPEKTYTPLPGDVANGEAMFNMVIDGTLPMCSSCHIAGGTAATPDLTGYGAIASERVPGQSAEEYTYYSIVDPGRYIVPGYGNVMYNRYDERLTEQQIADLIAYLLTQ